MYQYKGFLETPMECVEFLPAAQDQNSHTILFCDNREGGIVSTSSTRVMTMTAATRGHGEG